MRYAIVGAGALGSWIGARLLADGNEVAFADVGERRATLARDGLRMRDERGEAVHFAEIELIDDPAEAGHFDLLLLCVRCEQIEESLHLVRPLLARESAVIALQGGTGTQQGLRKVLGDDAVIPGYVNLDLIQDTGGETRSAISATARSPVSEARPAVLPPPGITLGELRPGGSWRLEALLAALSSAGIQAHESQTIEAHVCQYLAYRAPTELLCAARNETVGEVLAHAVDEWQDLSAEIWQAALARHPELSRPDPDETVAALRQFEGELRPAMLRDLDAGRLPEFHAFADLLTPAARQHFYKRLADRCGPLPPLRIPALPVQVVTRPSHKP